jgi:hypothetical protein
MSNDQGKNPGSNNKNEQSLWDKVFGANGLVGLFAVLVPLAALLYATHTWPFSHSSGATTTPEIQGSSPGIPTNMTPTPSYSSSPNSSDSPPKPNRPVNLKSALLPSEILSSAAYVTSESTDLSKVTGMCGAPVYGATVTADEQIVDHQHGVALDEVLVSWRSAADAGQNVTSNRQAVDQSASGSCSLSLSGSTATYTGDYQGSPPSNCPSPGQYFATVVSISFSSSAYPELPESGYVVEAQCGDIITWLRVYGGFGNSITQQTADGYLSSAIQKLDSANS